MTRWRWFVLALGIWGLASIFGYASWQWFGLDKALAGSCLGLLAGFGVMMPTALMFSIGFGCLCEA